MGVWVVDTVTNKCVDYSSDGSIRYDPRFYDNRIATDLPAGDLPRDYVFVGAVPLKRSRTPAELRRDDALAKIDLVAADVTISVLVRNALAAIKLIL